MSGGHNVNIQIGELAHLWRHRIEAYNLHDTYSRRQLNHSQVQCQPHEKGHVGCTIYHHLRRGGVLGPGLVEEYCHVYTLSCSL